MESLIEKDIFSPVRDSIQFFANEVIRSRNPILLVSKPNLEGSLSLAPIEAALLDARIPYKRRFSKSNPYYSPFIQINDDSASTKNELSGLSLSTTM